MKHNPILVLALCLAVVAPARVATTEASPPPPLPASHALHQGMALMEQAIAHTERLMPDIIKAAEGAARRWIDGGNLYAAGDGCATDELFYRAGGLITLRRIGAFEQNHNGSQVRWDKVPEQSVILYAMHRNADPGILLFDDLGHLMFERDTVVFFGSSRWLACKRSVEALRKRLPPSRLFFIDTDLPQETSFTTSDGRRYGDYAGMVTAIHAWAFTAELIAACTRQDKTPGIWPSGAIPGYEAWEAKYQQTKFHDDFTVRPIEAGVLGRRYLQILREQVQSCAASGPQIQAAARLLSGVPADRAVYTLVDSHLLAGETWLPKELSNWILVQRSWRWRRAALTAEKGDGVLWLGAFDWPAAEAEKAATLGNPFAAVSLYGPGQNPGHAALATPGGAPREPSPQAVGPSRIGVDPTPATGHLASTNKPSGAVWIPAPWQYPDAVLELDGYPLPACPSSSIVQGILLWGTIGEVLERFSSSPHPAPLP